MGYLIHLLASTPIIIGCLITRKSITIVQRISGKELFRNAISDGLHADVFREVFKTVKGDPRSAGSAQKRRDQDGNL